MAPSIGIARGSRRRASWWRRSSRVTGAPIALQIGRDLAGDVAFVEIVEAGMRELLERRPQGRLAHRFTERQRLAVGHELRRKAGRLGQRHDVARFGPCLRRRRRGCLRGRGGSRPGSAWAAAAGRRAIAPRPARAPSRRNGAGDGERGEGATGRDRVVAELAIVPDRRPGAGDAAASRKRTRLAPSAISQKPSPPIEFICG